MMEVDYSLYQIMLQGNWVLVHKYILLDMLVCIGKDEIERGLISSYLFTSFFFLKGVLVHIGSLVSSEFPNLMKMRKMILASTWYFSVFHNMPQIFLSHLMIL